MNLKLVVVMIVAIVTPIICTGVLHKQLNIIDKTHCDITPDIEMTEHAETKHIIKTKPRISPLNYMPEHHDKIYTSLEKDTKAITPQENEQQKPKEEKQAIKDKNEHIGNDEKSSITPRQKTIKKETFKATAYDLSVESCGTEIGAKGYGITANGTDLSGKAREEAMTVAVDPKVIKLGTKLKITFPEPYEHFTGIYTAKDTGGAIKGKKVDIFMGDFNNNKTHQSVWDFGIREVQVEIIR